MVSNYNPPRDSLIKLDAQQAFKPAPSMRSQGRKASGSGVSPLIWGGAGILALGLVAVTIMSGGGEEAPGKSTVNINRALGQLYFSEDQRHGMREASYTDHRNAGYDISLYNEANVVADINEGPYAGARIAFITHPARGERIVAVETGDGQQSYAPIMDQAQSGRNLSVSGNPDYILWWIDNSQKDGHAVNAFGRAASDDILHFQIFNDDIYQINMRTGEFCVDTVYLSNGDTPQTRCGDLTMPHERQPG